MRLTDKMRRDVTAVIRTRFVDKVERVDFDEMDEHVLLIRVVMAKTTSTRDFSGRFFGLTGQVRTALGEDMGSVFPVIRPVEAHA